MLYIVFIIIIVFLIVALGASVLYNSFTSIIVRIREAEVDIDSLLKKRFDLLSKSIPIVKENLKNDEEVLDKVVKLRSRKLNSFDLDRKLNGEVIEFLELIEKYPDLKNVNAFVKIYRSLRSAEETLVASKKYYNDTIVKYNKMIRTFPSNILANGKKYQTKDFYSFDDDYIEE